MPYIQLSSYRPPLWLRDGHAQTLYASVTRNVSGVIYERQRIETSDGDFLDLDWSRVGAGRTVIISHGLEGNTRRPYVLGMVRAMNQRGWDAVAWNFRGSSGERNRRLRFTHSGATDDLAAVIRAVRAARPGMPWALVGFSLGGNILLKYLGETGEHVGDDCLGGVAFSVPVDLRAAVDTMAARGNRLYMRRFLGDLHTRLKSMQPHFPNEVDLQGYEAIRDFRGFDDRYTAPWHGFRSAEEYWAASSSRPVLERIAVPTLLVNAVDDPFLPAACFPESEAHASPTFHFEAPKWGGHVGFVGGGNGDDYWSEVRACEFLERALGGAVSCRS